MTIDRALAKGVSDRLQEYFGEIGREFNVSLSMAGGKFWADGFTLKISGKALNEDGSFAVGESTNVAADSVARAAGVSYSTPHMIGSVWRFSSGLARVIDYKRVNRKYPFICQYYEDGRRCKASTRTFLRAREVKMPTQVDFRLWFETDIDDDRVTASMEETYDRVNDFISCRFDDNDNLETFMNLCGDCFDRALIYEGDRVADNVYKILFEKAGTLQQANMYMRTILK